MEGDFGFDRNRRYDFQGQQPPKEDPNRMLRLDRPVVGSGMGVNVGVGMNSYLGQHAAYPHQTVWDNAVPAHDPYVAKPVPLGVPRNDVGSYTIVHPPPSEYYPRFGAPQDLSFPPDVTEEHFHGHVGNFPHMGLRLNPQQQQQQQQHQQRYVPNNNMHMQQFVDSYRSAGPKGAPQMMNAGGSNAQGRAINKHLLDILRDRVVDAQRLDLLIDTYVERMDCVNLATLLFHTGKKRLVLIPSYVRRVAQRFLTLKEELRAREASNALYGLKCLSSDIPEVRELVHALATKIAGSNSDFVAQAVGNALYGLQMMTSEYEEVRYLLLVLASKVSRCTELLEAQNVGNALYGLRGMSSDYKEVRIMIAALTPKIASAREELNGQALGNSLYGLQCMNSKETEVRCLLHVLAAKVARTWEDLKAQEVGNALYGLKRMSTDVAEVRVLIAALVPKIAQSPDVLDAQAVGNSLYGLQNMRSDSPEVLSLLAVLAEKISVSCAELDGQAMGNSLYGLQGMSSDFSEVRAVVAALTVKILSSCLEMNAQELGNALYGLHNMNSSFKEVRKVIAALAQKVAASKHELTSQEIGNAIFGLQNMSSEHAETRILLQHLTQKIVQSHTVLDPQGVSNSLFGLQRLSSECVDVRHMVHALAYKVEHCWKLLGAHHVANACFGLQCLSSEEKEVRFLLKALISKIVSCREEMNAKQLSHAIFGLHRMSSNHLEVLAMVTALAEKVSLSTDMWNGHYLSLALFGLQGLASNTEEVTLLLGALAHKASLASLTDLDPTMLGNCFYGLQRCDTGNPEVCNLLSVLAGPLVSFAQYNPTLHPSIVANILFGVHGFSAHIEAVRSVLNVVASSIAEVVQSGASFAGLRHEVALEAFLDLLCLYQSTAVSIHNIPDLDAYSDLKFQLTEQQSKLQQVIELNSRFYQARNLTAAETLAAQEISRVLAREPVMIRTGALVYGFDMSVFIQLSPNLDLKTAAGVSFNPVLGLDVVGTSFSHPAKELFHSLRCMYLEKQRGVAMRAVPADAFRTAGQGGLWRHMHVFGPLLCPTPEDTVAVNNQLSARGIVGMSYMSAIVASSSPEDMNRFAGSQAGSSNSSASGGGSSQYPPSGGVNRLATAEYLDDDFHKQFNEYADQAVRYNRKPLGMLLGWLGEWPRISHSPLTHMLAMHHHGQHQQQLQQQQQQQQQQHYHYHQQQHLLQQQQQQQQLGGQFNRFGPSFSAPASNAGSAPASGPSTPVPMPMLPASTPVAVSGINATLPSMYAGNRSVPAVDKRGNLVAERGMIPVMDPAHPMEKPFHMREGLADYMIRHPDAPFAENPAASVRAFNGANVHGANDDESVSTTSDPNTLQHNMPTRQLQKPAFDQQHPGLAVPSGSASSLTGLLNRNYHYQFPTEELLRIDTVKYDAAGHFLAPDYNHSSSFTGHIPNYPPIGAKPVSSAESAVSSLGDPVKPIHSDGSTRSQRSGSDASEPEHFVVMPGLGAGDLSSGMSSSCNPSLSKEQHLSGGYGDYQDDDGRVAQSREDDEMALLQAQMEMAKLEARIKSLQSKKSQAARTTVISKAAAQALLGSSSDNF